VSVRSGLAESEISAAMRRKLDLLLFSLVLGLALGIGIFTFVYAKGYSYLTDDPGACANCHIMDAHLDAWLKSSHHSVAVCNDCHTPAGFISKYLVKASNGFNHSVAFTTGQFPDPLRITPSNHEVTEGACLKCHADLVESIMPHQAKTTKGLSCIRCHDSVGHWVR
jgi:cytochrome c nitrite reductase small subunit